MNVMKQDAMDDKTTEGWKTCEKQIFQQEKCYAHRSQNTHTHQTSLTNFIFQKQIKTV